MAVKSVLVPIDGGAASFAALNQACVIAKRFGAHIVALHVMQRVSDGAPVGLYNLSADMRKDIEQKVEAAELDKSKELQAQFEDLCKKCDVAITDRPTDTDGATAAWYQQWGRANDVIVSHGRVSDVIVVRRPELKKDTIRRSRLGENIEAVLRSTARPVLLVPPGSEAKECGKIAIGWNESAEASRALAMTLPWISAMGAATVMISKKREPRVKQLVDYLSWHGVMSDVVLLDGKGDTVGEAMLNTCSEIGAELLVVGGFSQGRARQLFFGGVTGHLLSNSNILTVMVH
jgi:nucleotide-binding universal stress UspA family protein